MPLGYGAPEVLSRGFGAFRDRALTDRNFDKFRRGFAHGSNPGVEGEYLVVKDRNSRAIAGFRWAAPNRC